AVERRHGWAPGPSPRAPLVGDHRVRLLDVEAEPGSFGGNARQGELREPAVVDVLEREPGNEDAGGTREVRGDVGPDLVVGAAAPVLPVAIRQDQGTRADQSAGPPVLDPSGLRGLPLGAEPAQAIPPSGGFARRGVAAQDRE